MKQHIVPAGGGQDYDWSNDHVYVKTPRSMTEVRVTVVEDTLKPGFDLARHYHKKMVEIFYVLHGEVTGSRRRTAGSHGRGDSACVRT
jgi:quercetin dioxygenase-like cupin family protein